MLPLEIPFPEPSSLADFPHHVSQPGVCSSNFPIDRTLPSLGCSSGVLGSLENLLLPVLSLFMNWKGLGLHIAPTVPRKKAGGLLGLNNEELERELSTEAL